VVVCSSLFPPVVEGIFLWNYNGRVLGKVTFEDRLVTSRGHYQREVIESRWTLAREGFLTCEPSGEAETEIMWRFDQATERKAIPSISPRESHREFKKERRGNKENFQKWNSSRTSRKQPLGLSGRPNALNSEEPGKHLPRRCWGGVHFSIKEAGEQWGGKKFSRVILLNCPRGGARRILCGGMGKISKFGILLILSPWRPAVGLGNSIKFSKVINLVP